MITQDQIRLPFPKEYLKDYVSRLFLPIKRGECVTSVWVGTAGRRVASQFVMDHIELFKEEVPNYKNYLLVYVEPLDLTEESQPGYLRLIGTSFVNACKKNTDLGLEFKEEDIAVFSNEEAQYSKLLEVLKDLISKVIDRGFEVVMFLGEIDELSFVNSIFCNNIRSLWNRFDGKLHYIFLIKDVRLFFNKGYFSEDLGYLFFQNVLYTPVSKDNEDYLINYFEERLNYRLSPEKKQALQDLCDGHPYFIKLAMESLAKKDLPNDPLSVESIKKTLRDNYEIRAASDRMLEVLSENMKNFLSECSAKTVKDLPSGEENQVLISLGLIKQENDGSYKPFCELFQNAILNKAMPEVASNGVQKKVSYDPKLNTVIVGGKPIEEKLTRQEYEVLSCLLREPEKLFSRDEIAGAIWGKNSFEKYSDWAIDQLISKLRKKLDQLGVGGKSLITVRGKGYKLTNSS